MSVVAIVQSVEAWFVCYDIAAPRRLRRVAAAVEPRGVRLQRSVFECALDADSARTLARAIQNCSDMSEDRALLVPICRTCRAGQLTQGLLPPASSLPYWVV